MCVALFSHRETNASLPIDVNGPTVTVEEFNGTLREIVDWNVRVQ